MSRKSNKSVNANVQNANVAEPQVAENFGPLSTADAAALKERIEAAPMVPAPEQPAQVVTETAPVLDKKAQAKAKKAEKLAAKKAKIATKKAADKAKKATAKAKKAVGTTPLGARMNTLTAKLETMLMAGTTLEAACKATGWVESLIKSHLRHIGKCHGAKVENKDGALLAVPALVKA